MHTGFFASTTASIRRFAWAVALVVLLSSAASTRASSYRIRGDLTRFYGPPSTQTNLDGFDWSSTTSVTTSDSRHQNGQPFSVPGSFDVNTFASAEGYRARLSVNSTYQRDLPVASPGSDGFDRFDAGAAVDLTFDDMIITGPGSSVSANIRVHLDGSLSSSTLVTTTPGSDYASANLSSQLAVNNVTRGDGSFFVDSQDGNPNTGGFGWLANFDGDDVLTSNAFTVNTATPFTVRLSISLSARAGMDDQKSGRSVAVVDFANTLSFVEGQPVFILPAGYTANSASAGIVNNVYVGVPEPTAATTLGLAALIALGRRSRSVSSVA